MSQLVRKPATFFGLLGLIVLIPLVLRFTRTAAAAPQQGAPTAIQLQVAMIRAGLSPESLAAAGVSSQSVAGVTTAMNTALTSEPLAPLDSAFGEARAAHDARQRKIQSGLASQEEISGYAALEQALATAETNRNEAIADLFTAATANLTGQQRALLQAIEANNTWHVPTEFLTVHREEADWVELRDALTNERVCAKNGETPHQGCQSLLSTARANGTVAAAKTNLDTHLSSIKIAWENATAVE